MLQDLLGNAALVGLVGVVIGSGLSLYGIMYSERIKLKTIELQQKQLQKEQTLKSYTNFIHLVNQYQNFYLSQIMQVDKFMTTEDAAALIKSAEMVLAELDIRASEELSRACHDLFNKTFSALFNQEEYQTQYRKVIDLMKKELAAQ